MKKPTQRLLALFLGLSLLASCVPEGVPEETDAAEKTTAGTEKTNPTELTDPETGEPIRILPAESEVLSLKPREMNGDLVRTDSTFRIKTRSDMEAEALSALLSVEPGSEMHVTKNGKCDFTLDVGALPKGEIFKVMLGDGNGNTVDSWGFQTEDEFRVLSSFPADQSENVVTGTGIEIELSYPADLAGIGNYFEISPPVSGRFSNHSSTLVFIPGEELAKKTVYTVTLKKGLPSSNGATLSENHSFTFRTREGDLSNFCFAVNGFTETYLPDDPVVIDVYHSPLFLDREFDFKLYQYRNGEDYARAIRDYYESTSWTGEYEIPADGLPVVMDDKLPLFHSEKKNEYYYRGDISSFVLPDHLEEGYYLAALSTQLDGEEFLIQRLIQISPISVYAGVLSGQAMFFVNDTDSGSAAENAEITFSVGGSDYSAKTDRDGVALLDYAAKEAEAFHEGMTTEAIRETDYPESGADRAGLLKIEYGGRVFYDRMNCVADRELTPEEKYFMYLFTDRTAYLPSDTIEVWGVIRPRKAGTSVPDGLTLKFGNGDTDGIVKNVLLSPDGTFMGKFTYERLAETWWSPISLCDGENELCTVNVQIRDYVKPVYTLDPVLPESVWMPQENGVTAGINISYYDGTPAEGRQVKIMGNDPLISDKNGYAERVVYRDESIYAIPSGPWGHYYVDYELSGIENEYLTASGVTIGFFRDVELDIEGTRADDLSASLDLNAYQVDIGNLRIEKGEYYSYPVPESYRGAPADLTVTAEITRSWNEKTESGSYYDFIQKKNFPLYTYNRYEETVGTYTAEVKNGVGSFRNLPMTDPNSDYEIILRWKDSAGREMSKRIYESSGSAWFYPETDVLTYDLFSKDNAEKPYDPALGETRSLTLRENNAALSPQDFKGRIFYAIYQDKVLSTGVSDQCAFTFTMEEKYIPSFYLTAAYFDGKHIFPMEYGNFFSFSPDQREIDLDLKTDRESYAPAESAEVTLTARTANGKPVPNARILLSVVDEAAFAVADQTAQPLEQLYRAVYYPMADSYVSYIQHTMYSAIGGGGKGGGEPEGIRRKFLDTAYFAEGVSDANGRLTLSVELPDNVTSWRFTALAVGEYDNGRLYAGTTRRNISATLPVFITPIMLSEYVEGDEIVFSAHCGGDPDAKITAEVNGGGFSETLSADEDGEFAFGRLPLGEYTVLFRTEGDRGTDAAEYPFRVVKARLTDRIKKDFDLADGAMNISPAAYPVFITLYNKETILFNEVLCTLESRRGTNLNDRIAREYAYAEHGYTDAERFPALVRSETADGTARLYSYAEPDYELTALLCAAFPEDADRTAVASCLKRTLTSADEALTNNEKASCYLALAALNQPYLCEIRDFLENEKTLSAAEKLKLCTALGYLGDRNTALRYYTDITKNLVLYQKDGEIFATFSEKNTEDSNVIQGDTRLALMAASVLNLPEAEGMARWLCREKRRDYACSLELAAFLKNYKPALHMNAKASYRLGGTEKTVEIDSFYGTTLAFGEEQLQNADFRVLEGTVGAQAVYEGLTEELEESPALTVKKTITPLSDTDGKGGSLYRVDLEIDGEGSYFTVEDMIPSNARFAYAETSSDYRKVYVEHNDGQDVSITLYRTKIARYYIRRVTKGECVLEGASALNEQGSFGIAEKGIF